MKLLGRFLSRGRYKSRNISEGNSIKYCVDSFECSLEVVDFRRAQDYSLYDEELVKSMQLYNNIFMMTFAVFPNSILISFDKLCLRGINYADERKIMSLFTAHSFVNQFFFLILSLAA